MKRSGATPPNGKRAVEAPPRVADIEAPPRTISDEAAERARRRSGPSGRKIGSSPSGEGTPAGDDRDPSEDPRANRESVDDGGDGGGGTETRRGSRSFPELDLPRWLLTQSRKVFGRMWLAVRVPPYRRLARFSHDLGTCVNSTADLTRGLELCLKPLRGTALGEHWSGAVAAVRRGESLHAALAPAEPLLPPFYLPVLRAGEESGTLAEALEFLETHCQLLAGPASALRNLWFYPAVILAFGSLARVLVAAWMVSLGTAVVTFGSEFFSWTQIVVVVAIATMTPLRYFIDQVRLVLPLWGELEREIALHRFFRVMSLIYSVGGDRVEQMIRTAAQTVGNDAARLDLCRAAKAIEGGATIDEAFRRVTILSEDEKTTIEVGEMSGTLELAFAQISDLTGDSMVTKLRFIEPILVRIVSALVIFSILSTMLQFLF